MQYKDAIPTETGYYFMRWETNAPAADTWARRMVRITEGADGGLWVDELKARATRFELSDPFYEKVQFAGPVPEPEGDGGRYYS